MDTTKKRMLCTHLVFGDTYQDYIPLFVYSFKKFYPEYDVCIVIDSKLLPDVQKSLDILGEEIILIDNYFDRIGYSGSAFSQAGKSLRWVMHEPIFDNYDSVYIGDIDILICPEELDIYEQHITHCDVLKLPYSNMLRHGKSFLSCNPKAVAIRLYREGIVSAVKSLVHRTRIYNRLTGLHFIKTRDYFNNVDPLIPKYLLNIKSGKRFGHHLNGLSNEALLYDLTSEAGIPLSERAVAGEMLFIDPKQCGEVFFRPHHGIHLGIFRSDPITRTNAINTPIYEQYFKVYADVIRNDSVFQMLMRNSPDHIAQIFFRLDLYIKDRFGW